MADNKPQSDGAIYINNYKKSQNQPDWTGKVSLDNLLKELVNKVKANEEAELRVALWDRTSKNGNEYKYARLDIPMVQDKPAPKQEETKSDQLEEIDLPF